MLPAGERSLFGTPALGDSATTTDLKRLHEQYLFQGIRMPASSANPIGRLRFGSLSSLVYF
jgi:hypothetical protein